jgi:hypothetical protein
MVLLEKIKNEKKYLENVSSSLHLGRSHDHLTLHFRVLRLQLPICVPLSFPGDRVHDARSLDGAVSLNLLLLCGQLRCMLKTAKNKINKRTEWERCSFFVFLNFLIYIFYFFILHTLAVFKEASVVSTTVRCTASSTSAFVLTSSGSALTTFK